MVIDRNVDTDKVLLGKLEAASRLGPIVLANVATLDGVSYRHLKEIISDRASSLPVKMAAQAILAQEPPLAFMRKGWLGNLIDYKSGYCGTLRIPPPMGYDLNMAAPGWAKELAARAEVPVESLASCFRNPPLHECTGDVFSFALLCNKVDKTDKRQVAMTYMWAITALSTADTGCSGYCPEFGEEDHSRIINWLLECTGWRASVNGVTLNPATSSPLYHDVGGRGSKAIPIYPWLAEQVARIGLGPNPCSWGTRVLVGAPIFDVRVHNYDGWQKVLSTFTNVLPMRATDITVVSYNGTGKGTLVSPKIRNRLGQAKGRGQLRLLHLEEDTSWQTEAQRCEQMLANVAESSWEDFHVPEDETKAAAPGPLKWDDILHDATVATLGQPPPSGPPTHRSVEKAVPIVRGTAIMPPQSGANDEQKNAKNWAASFASRTGRNQYIHAGKAFSTKLKNAEIAHHTGIGLRFLTKARYRGGVHRIGECARVRHGLAVAETPWEPLYADRDGRHIHPFFDPNAGDVVLQLPDGTDYRGWSHDEEGKWVDQSVDSSDDEEDDGEPSSHGCASDSDEVHADDDPVDHDSAREGSPTPHGTDDDEAPSPEADRAPPPKSGMRHTDHNWKGAEAIGRKLMSERDENGAFAKLFQDADKDAVEFYVNQPGIKDPDSLQALYQGRIQTMRDLRASGAKEDFFTRHRFLDGPALLVAWGLEPKDRST
jgi:hypothetical protein